MNRFEGVWSNKAFLLLLLVVIMAFFVYPVFTCVALLIVGCICFVYALWRF